MEVLRWVYCVYFTNKKTHPRLMFLIVLLLDAPKGFTPWRAHISQDECAQEKELRRHQGQCVWSLRTCD